jgi:hypothetical protein
MHKTDLLIVMKRVKRLAVTGVAILFVSMVFAVFRYEGE